MTAVDPNWERAKEEIREILRCKARDRAMITYSELVSQVQTMHLEPNSPELRLMLGEISTSEHAAGRGMLTVIVVHKHDDMQPGNGFYELARRLRCQFSDKDKFWIDELKRVHYYWSTAKAGF